MKCEKDHVGTLEIHKNPFTDRYTSRHPPMPTLLCTLGSSWAVVPEAFLLGNGADAYASVCILTTDSEPTRKSLGRAQDWFREHHPETQVRALAIEGLADLACAEDHARFEEALYRAYFAMISSHEPLHVCLAGGFKTMSAAAQEAAGLLGCASLFHITAPLGIRTDTHEEILAAIERCDVRHIDLGARVGWPTIRELATEAPSLPPEHEPFCIENTHLADKIRARIEAASRLAASEAELATLPFPQIARWSPGERATLEEPLHPETDAGWLLSLPKVELHCHLGGFATHGTELEAVRSAARFPETLPPLSEPVRPDDWPLPKSSISLSNYMQLGNANGSALLKDPGCLQKQCELLYEHFLSQNIVYAEVRCSPANYASPGRSPWTVLQEIKQTFDRCSEAANHRLAESVPVAANVPFAESVASSVSLDVSASRQFIPFEKEADYHQSWRNLPHRHQANATVFITFRLADSLPTEKLQSWHREQTEFIATHPKPWDQATHEFYRRHFPKRLENWLDEAHGKCLLSQPEIASIVETALRHFDGDRYILDAFVIMPNHVHVLVKPLTGHELREIVHSWKSYTAKRINQQLDQTGQVWEHESFDHLLRSVQQLDRLRDYIRDNPKAAGLKDGYVVGKGLGLVEREEPSIETIDGSDPTCETLITAPATTATVPQVNLIIIATRRERGDYRAAIGRHLTLAVTAAEHWRHQSGCQLVGVDLAGYEDISTRAHYFREDFLAVHRCGLALTVHAGENDDAEGIWSAVFDLNTRRIGHALTLQESPDLLRTVAERNIGVEMCPYANLQIKGFALAVTRADAASGTLATTVPTSQRLVATDNDTTSYPLLSYLRAGVSVTVNTDNIGISDASLTENFMLLPRLCPGIRRLDVLQLLRNAVDQAFISPSQKNRLLAQMTIPHH